MRTFQDEAYDLLVDEFERDEEGVLADAMQAEPLYTAAQELALALAHPNNRSEAGTLDAVKAWRVAVLQAALDYADQHSGDLTASLIEDARSRR